MVAIATLSVGFISCNDDDEKGNVLTPQTAKEQLAADSDELLQEMQDLKNEKGISALASLDYFLSVEQKEVIVIPEEKKSGLKSADDILRINRFNQTMTWNASTESWDIVEGGNEFIIKYPATPEGKTNNAQITITGEASPYYMTIEEERAERVYDPEYEYYYYDYYTVSQKQEMPKKLNLSIKVDGTEVATGALNADFEGNDKAPRSADCNLTFGKYSFVSSAAKATGIATTSLKKNGKDLMALSGKFTGNIDEMITDEEASSGTGNASMSILNKWKLAGDVDFQNYSTESDQAEYKYEMETYTCDTTYYMSKNNTWTLQQYLSKREAIEKEYVESSVASENKYIKFSLIYTPDNSTIANLKSEAVKETYTTTYSDHKTDKNVEVTINEWHSNPMLYFNDGSKAEPAVYFSEGFDTVIEHWMNFIQNFQE